LTRALLAAALLLAGCPSPVCPTLAMRCAGPRVEVCDARGQWALVADCDVVAAQSGGEWACAETRDDAGELLACMPEAR
jgi:hypothetical protein